MKKGTRIGALLLTALIAVAALFAVGTTLGDTQVQRPDIRQFTLQRSGVSNALEPFRQEIVLIPALYDTLSTEDKTLSHEGASLSCALWNDGVANAVDHIVTVKNEGDGDGYVRIWFAIEQGELSEAELFETVKLNRNETDWRWSVADSHVSIGDTAYCVLLAEYTVDNGLLRAGETTAASLLQLLIVPTASPSTLAKLDSDGNGTYKIYVKTQTVSDSDAWTAAFGDSHPWSGTNN